MENILFTGDVWGPALIVFAIITALKLNLKDWFNERAAGITSMVLSVAVVELLVLKADGNLEGYLNGIGNGFLVSLAIVYGHDKLAAFIEQQTIKKLEKEK